LSKNKALLEKKISSEIELNRKLKSYFTNFVASFCILVDRKTDLANVIEYDLEGLFNNIIGNEKKAKHVNEMLNANVISYGSIGDENSESASCECCYTSQKDCFASLTESNNTIVNKYSRACVNFTAFTPKVQDLHDELDGWKFELSAKFTDMYRNLKFFKISRHDIKIENGCLEQLSDLREIELIKNKLVSIPSSIFKLKTLEIIRIVDNPVQSITAQKDLFESLSSLKYLELSYLKLDIKMLEKEASIKLPSSLKELHLIGLPVDFMIFDVTKCKQSLTKLTFSGVSWVNIYDYGGNNAILSMEHCMNEMNTKNMIFSKKQITSLIPKFDDNGNGFLETEEVIKLNAYIYKKFLRLGLNLTKEEQNIKSGVPLCIFDCVNLVELNLSYQAIRFIPDEIENLKSLKKLNLSNCILLHSVSAKCGNMELEELKLDNCMSLKTPPLEVNFIS
jgi:Leucine-rich repeat (LRR) protein